MLVLVVEEEEEEEEEEPLQKQNPLACPLLHDSVATTGCWVRDLEVVAVAGAVDGCLTGCTPLPGCLASPVYPTELVLLSFRDRMAGRVRAAGAALFTVCTPPSTTPLAATEGGLSTTKGRLAGPARALFGLGSCMTSSTLLPLAVLVLLSTDAVEECALRVGAGAPVVLFRDPVAGGGGGERLRSSASFLLLLA